jgi:hypothetical protein
MLLAADQLAEAERIQKLLDQAGRPTPLRLMGSLAVWYYSQTRNDILERAHRIPRDIDFIFSTGSTSAIVRALEAAGYECDMQLLFESQGNRIRAIRSPYKVDAFADPVVLRQTLYLGPRLRLCAPCISLTDLLLLKLQLRGLAPRDLVDICALLAASHGAIDRCCEFDTERFHDIVGGSWTWWKTVKISLDKLERDYGAIVLEPQQRCVIQSLISQARSVLDSGGRTLKWKLGRAADAVLPDSNEVDET